MAKKMLGIEQRELEVGKEMVGFLVEKTVVNFPKEDGTGISTVPKLILREQDTPKIFGVLLGAAAIDSVTQMQKGFLTGVKKLAKVKGKRYFPYETWQDNEVSMADYPVQDEE
jgi:hypothetical protein